MVAKQVRSRSDQWHRAKIKEGAEDDAVSGHRQAAPSCMHKGFRFERDIDQAAIRRGWRRSEKVGKTRKVVGDGTSSLQGIHRIEQWWAAYQASMAIADLPQGVLDVVPVSLA
jgi:hypothetical protein